MMKTNDKVLEKFRDLFIDRLQTIEKDYTQPWITPTSYNPTNLDGKKYVGLNSFILAIHSESKHFQYPIYGTFNKVKSLGGHIEKGATGVPVRIYIPLYEKDNEKITKDEFNQLSDKEKEEYRFSPTARTYYVFNIDDTNLKQVQPDLYKALVESHKEHLAQFERERFEIPAIDQMIDNKKWLCPVYFHDKLEAYYSHSKDNIHISPRETFKSDHEYYSTLVHEMAHSTGHESRLNRTFGKRFGDKDYAKEELVAELTASFTATKLGFSKHVLDNNVAYIKSWLKSLRNDVSYIDLALKAVAKASNLIDQTIDKSVDKKLTNEVVKDNFEYNEEDRKKAVEDLTQGKTINLPSKKGLLRMNSKNLLINSSRNIAVLEGYAIPHEILPEGIIIPDDSKILSKLAEMDIYPDVQPVLTIVPKLELKESLKDYTEQEQEQLKNTFLVKDDMILFLDDRVNQVRSYPVKDISLSYIPNFSDSDLSTLLSHKAIERQDPISKVHFRYELNPIAPKSLDIQYKSLIHDDYIKIPSEDKKEEEIKDYLKKVGYQGIDHVFSNKTLKDEFLEKNNITEGYKSYKVALSNNDTATIEELNSKLTQQTDTKRSMRL